MQNAQIQSAGLRKEELKSEYLEKGDFVSCNKWPHKKILHIHSWIAWTKPNIFVSINKNLFQKSI